MNRCFQCKICKTLLSFVLSNLKVFEMKEVIDCLCKGVKMGEPYPPSIRAFCLALHYLSPRAYRYLREKFGNHIPHPQTIRQWYRNSNLDSSSGIGQHALDALQAKSDEVLAKQKQQLIISITFDEMAIQRNLTYCRTSNKFVGLIDKGAEDANDEFTLANNVIVFMAVGVNAQFQQPVAFYFIRTLVAKDRMDLVNDVLTEIAKRGVKVSNITFDGNTANAPMCEQLGANFSSNTGDYITHFPNPHDKSNVYIIYDFSHVEKLVRNTLGGYTVLWHNNEKIEWKYFIELVKYSRETSLGLTHKLNKRHLEYVDRKMHVRTAVETFSRSTADSMEYCRRNGVPGFEKAAETIEFTRIMDTLWDVMNSQRILGDEVNKYKSAMNPRNKGEVFAFLLKAKEYILSLKIESKISKKKILIVKSRVKTGFRGFVIDIISVTAMYHELVDEHHYMLFLATYRLSQDHVEMFFGKIRSMNGFNENPMSPQFISAYRKLSYQSDVSISDRANVIERGASNVLTITSGAKRLTSLEEDVMEHIIHDDNQEKVPPYIDPKDDLDEFFELQLLENNDFLSDNMLDVGVCYMSNIIERRLTTCDQINCRFCPQVFVVNDKVENKACVSTHLGKPCLSTYQLCKITDKMLKIYINSGLKFHQKVYLKVLSILDWKSIFPKFFEPEHDSAHKNFLVKFIIDEYIKKKCAYIAKQTTISLQKKYNRNRLRKIAHFSHL